MMIERIFIDSLARTVTEYLENKGWSATAAAGIVDHLSLSDLLPLNICRWQGGRFGKMADWCSASERDPTLLESQLDYLDYDLRNAYHKVGAEIGAATSAAEARKAFAPYIDAEWIKEGEIRWLTHEEANDFRPLGTLLH
jgi:hypothetical protein